MLKFDKFAGSKFERAKRARRVAGRTPAINLLTPTNSLLHNMVVEHCLGSAELSDLKL